MRTIETIASPDDPSKAIIGILVDQDARIELPFDVDIDLGTGRRLTGTVNSVFADRLVSVTYSKLGGQHLLASWIPLLALTAQRGQQWSAVCIGRPPRGTTPRIQGLDGPNDSVGLLRDLVAMYDEGRRRPLPLPIKTSYAWAGARHVGDDPAQAANYRWRNERDDPAIARVWGRDPGLDELVGLDEYAQRLWLPLLQAEGVAP